MHKKIGAILLVAGTCIGSGMIALPMVLAKLGLIPSVLLMLTIWFVMYYTSLINLELNLQADRGLTLGELGKHFSGRGARIMGTVSLKMLSYSLLAVFIYGGASILQELMTSRMEVHYSFESIASGFTLAALAMLLLPVKLIDYFNRLLFIGLMIVITILIVGLTISVEWSHLPLFTEHYLKPTTWMALIPIVFTSFGFQVIFQTLTHYCDKNAKMLKTAFFWGSLIPALVYILWTCNILSVVYHNNPLFYSQMVEGKAEVGELIQVLSGIAKWPVVQLLVWLISLLAIFTSVLGVGLGLFDSTKEIVAKIVPRNKIQRPLNAFITLVPAYLAVLYVPNAFIAVLGFAGMILAILAIILPVYLFGKIKTPQLFFKELRQKWLIKASLVTAVVVMLCEVYNMLAK